MVIPLLLLLLSDTWEDIILVGVASPLRSAIMRIPRVYGDGDDRGRDGSGQG